MRYVGERWLDNDSANLQPRIPAHTVVDMRIGGKLQQFFWSVSVLNVFNELYFDYGIASLATIGRYSAYPQPGRTVMVRLGVELEAPGAPQ